MPHILNNFILFLVPKLGLGTPWIAEAVLALEGPKRSFGYILVPKFNLGTRSNVS